MKAVHISGVFLLLLSLSTDLYNRFVYLPHVRALENRFMEFNTYMHNEISATQQVVWQIVIITGLSGFMLCRIPVLKKRNQQTLIGILFFLSYILSGLIRNS